MTTRITRALWAKDARDLRELGRALDAQHPSVSVTIPRALANRAMKAWERNDDDRAMKAWERNGDEGRLGRETGAQRRERHRAGSLALIGYELSTQRLGRGVNPRVRVSAYLAGEAMQAFRDDD